MEYLQYVIEDNTIAYLLGVNNFTNDEAAILELVKNSYDARALHVDIMFSGDRLVISDNGQGWTRMILEERGCMLEKVIRIMKSLMQIIIREF